MSLSVFVLASSNLRYKRIKRVRQFRFRFFFFIFKYICILHYTFPIWNNLFATQNNMPIDITKRSCFQWGYLKLRKKRRFAESSINSFDSSWSETAGVVTVRYSVVTVVGKKKALASFPTGRGWPSSRQTARVFSTLNAIVSYRLLVESSE